MMLSKVDIETHLDLHERINNLQPDSSGKNLPRNKLDIEISWIITNDTPEDWFVKEEVEKLKKLQKQIFNDRIAVHLGDLIYIFRNIEDFNKYKWTAVEDNTNIIDLKNTDGGYRLEPGESVVAMSAENFELPDSLAGIVVSRKSNQIIGLECSTTFIDAGWNGVITFSITNNGAHPRSLRQGQEVARLFLFELKSNVIAARENIKNGSEHPAPTLTQVRIDNMSPFLGNNYPCKHVLKCNYEDTKSFFHELAKTHENYKILAALLKFKRLIMRWLDRSRLTLYVLAFISSVAAFIYYHIQIEKFISSTKESFNIFQDVSSIKNKIKAQEKEISSLKSITNQRILFRKKSTPGEASVKFKHDIGKTIPPEKNIPSIIISTYSPRQQIKYVNSRVDEFGILEVEILLNSASRKEIEIDIECILFWGEQNNIEK